MKAVAHPAFAVAYPQRCDLVRKRSERVLGIAPESRANRKLRRGNALELPIGSRWQSWCCRDLDAQNIPTLLRWVVRISHLSGMSISSYTRRTLTAF